MADETVAAEDEVELRRAARALRPGRGAHRRRGGRHRRRCRGLSAQHPGYFGETKVTIDEYEGDDDELILDITGGDLAVLIGRHGRTLDALQMVVSSLMSSTLRFHYPVVVDVEGYKKRRKEKLRGIALSAASRAKRQHSKVSLPPMNAYERRLVHLALVDDDEVTTHSEGEDPSRHVVVTALRA